MLSLRVAAASLGPFKSIIQTRCVAKTPTSTARLRLETRSKDLTLDKLTRKIRRLNLILSIHELVKRPPYVSLNILSRLAPRAGLSLPAGKFIAKYPHIFHAFTHPVKRNACCKFRPKFLELLRAEDELMFTQEIEKLNVDKIKKILLMSVNGSVHVHSIRLLRSEFGLPEDFRESIIRKYDREFRLVDLETVELVDGAEGNEVLRVAEVEKWRRKEYDEKWLSEFEVRYAFPMDFPYRFKKGPAFNERLANWQRLHYVKAYEPMDKVRTCGGGERYEKRAVGIIHELLCLTVEKRMEVERLSHFRKDLGYMVNIREVLLRHPGIFYISIRGNNQMVFLREAYHKGCMIQPNPIYDIRRKLLDLVLLGRRSTRQLLPDEESKEESKEKTSDNICQRTKSVPRVGDFVLQILGSDINH